MTDLSDFSGTPDQRRARNLALVAGALAAVAGIGLLALSGWFLTGAALAGLGGLAAAQGFNYLLPSATIRAFAIIRTLGRYGERLLGHRAALFVLADLRPRLFARLANASPWTVAGLAGGDVAARLGGDVEALETFAIRRVSVGAALFGALAGLGVTAMAGALPLAVLAGGLLATTLLASRFAPRWLAGPAADHGQALLTSKAAYAEYSACSVEIAVYGLAPRISADLAEKAASIDRARSAVVRRESALQGLHGLLAALTVAGVIATARSELPFTALAALASAATFEGWSAAIHTFVQDPQAKAAQRRLAMIAELPGRPGGPPSNAGPLHIAADTGSVTILAGRRVRIAGPSGSGKSRLIATLAGLRDDAPEQVKIDGQNIIQLGSDAVRPLFALSPQDAPLIAGTVADNLRLARSGVTDAEMWRTLQVACLADTVQAMPEGLATWLGPDGARLSGGQRKRLSLARALLACRPWLVLDEPSEGLDLATERALALNLDAWLRETGTGLVLVNHRPGLDWLCDQELRLA